MSHLFAIVFSAIDGVRILSVLFCKYAKKVHKIEIVESKKRGKSSEVLNEDEIQWFEREREGEKFKCKKTMKWMDVCCKYSECVYGLALLYNVQCAPSLSMCHLKRNIDWVKQISVDHI